MTSRMMLGSAGMMLFFSGCTTLNSTAKVNEAAKLAQQKTGVLPDWQAEWDQQPPWNGQVVIRRDEAVGIALRNNRELRADLETIGEADADLLQSGLLQNPVVNLMLMFPDGGGRAMIRANSLPMMMLQDLWLVPARKKVARAMLQQAILRVADRAVETAASVKRVYVRLQYSQRAIELMRENLQVIDQSTRILSTRLSAGKGTQVQVNLSQIRFLKQRSDLFTMEADHKASQRELLMLMGLASASDDWKVEPLAEMKDDVHEPMPEAALLSTALQQRLDLLAAQWETQAAEHNILLAQREGLPELALGFSLERPAAPQSNNQTLAGRIGNDAFMGARNAQLGMPPAAGVGPAPFMPKARDMKWMLGPMLQFTIPIFDYGQGKVARARAEHRQKYAMYESRVQELTRMVREKLVMLDQASTQVRFYRQDIMPAVERNLDVARRSFIGGMEDLTIYLEVQEDLLMTRLKILQFYRDYLVNLVDVERQVGGSFELLGQLPTATQPATQPETDHQSS